MNDFSSKFQSWHDNRQANIVEPVSILPSNIFFLTSTDIPKDTSSKKLSHDVIENMAYTALEASSPFPPEDLYWGYYIHESSAHIHIFSALKSRVHTIEPLADDCTYLFPTFAIAILIKKYTSMVVKYGNETIFIKKEQDGGLNISHDVNNDSTVPLIELTEVSAVPAVGVQFIYTEINKLNNKQSAHTITLKSLSNHQLYELNVQTQDNKKQLLANKKKIQACLMTTLVSLLAIAIFSIGFIHIKQQIISQKNKSKQLVSRNEHVSKIQQKSERTEELDLFFNKKQVYFRLLEQINSVRPHDLTFLSLYASSGETISMKCNAPALEDIEEFKKNIEAFDNIETITIENKQMKNNHTIDFSISLKFKAL